MRWPRRRSAEGLAPSARDCAGRSRHRKERRPSRAASIPRSAKPCRQIAAHGVVVLHRRAGHRQEPHRRRRRTARRRRGRSGRAGRPDRPGRQAARGAVRAPASTLHRLLGAQARQRRRRRSTRVRPRRGLAAGRGRRRRRRGVDARRRAGRGAGRACADGTHLLFVGDPAQLPSIGPGRVLGDLIDSGAVPVTELTTLYRQAEGGTIARLATAVRGGELPPRRRPDPRGRDRPGAAGRPKPRTASSSWSPTRSRGRWHPGRAGAGRHAGASRPGRHPGAQRGAEGAAQPGHGHGRRFDVGDRVVATANHLEAEPFGYANGEVGVVTRSTPTAR